MTPTAPKPASSNTGCFAIIAVVGLILLIVQCSKGSSPPSTIENATTADMSSENAMAADLTTAIGSQHKKAVKPLSAIGASAGFGNERAAAKAEGLSGAMIYSQNCYDALSRTFSWAKLDTCGASDALAVRKAENVAATGFAKEVSYFDSETAAARFLSAATAAGEDAAEADQRWSGLQAQALAESIKPKTKIKKRTAKRIILPSANVSSMTAAEAAAAGIEQ